MKLPARYGLPLLLGALGLAWLWEGQLRFLGLIAAMGLALWTAFSLPPPQGTAGQVAEAAEQPELPAGSPKNLTKDESNGTG